MESTMNASFWTRLLRKVGLAAPAPARKRPDALRLGILGAAKVCPTSVIAPARELDSVTIEAIGARDSSRAAEYAAKHGIPKAYGSYDQVLQDPDIDAVYIPLLNGNHCEWTLKALQAGKHVLCEKPITVSEFEAQQVLEASKKYRRVVFEGFHNRHHPLLHRIKQLVDSGEIGQVTQVEAKLQFHWLISRFMDPDNSIHWDPAFGGGNLLEAGCYCVNAIRFASGSEPQSIEDASATGMIRGISESGVQATLKMENGVVGRMISNLRSSTIDMSLRIIGEKGELYTNNYIAPHLFHYLTVKTGESTRTEKHFDPSGASSYRLQLESFVNAIKTDASYDTNAADGVKNLRAVEMIFDAAGLPRRGKQPERPN